jgi:hypothetical protein
MDMTDEIETPQTAPAAAPDLTPGTRALLRTVYIMGIILVLLLIALIGGIIWKATSRTPKASEAAAVFDLGLEPGVAVTGVELDGDRMAVTTSEGIVVVDLRRRRVEARIGLRP